jgi:hypothetical protein
MNRRQLLHTIAAGPLAGALTTRSRAQAAQAPGAADRLIVISLDGVRTQEMFGGLDVDILQSVLEKKPANEHALYKKFWRPTREARREALMPFLWGTFLKSHGSIVGDQQAGSVMRLGNTQRFSYPGYAELMTGAPHDDVITSNDNKRYPFETVLQFLRRELGATREQVACFGSWDVFTSISASRDGEVYTNAGYQAYDGPDEGLKRLSAAQAETMPAWDSARYDTYTWQFAVDHVQRHQPRVLWIGLDESDDWSHQRHYVRLLEYLHRFDGWLGTLWTHLQSMPAYQGRTAVVLVTDHGRGNTAKDWSGHGKDVEGAQNVWAAFAAPQWKARGVWKSGHPVASQSQIAATLASLLGKDWRRASPAAGAPLVPPAL